MMGKYAWGRQAGARGGIALVAMLGLAACAIAHKPVDDGKPSSGSEKLDELRLVIDGKGNVSVIDKEGKQVDESCSTDPKSPNVCPLFKPGHKVEVEEITTLTGVRYKGSNCVTYMWTDTLGRARAITVCY